MSIRGLEVVGAAVLGASSQGLSDVVGQTLELRFKEHQLQTWRGAAFGLGGWSEDLDEEVQENLKLGMDLTRTKRRAITGAACGIYGLMSYAAICARVPGPISIPRLLAKIGLAEGVFTPGATIMAIVLDAVISSGSTGVNIVGEVQAQFWHLYSTSVLANLPLDAFIFTLFSQPFALLSGRVLLGTLLSIMMTLQISSQRLSNLGAARSSTTPCTTPRTEAFDLSRNSSQADLAGGTVEVEGELLETFLRRPRSRSRTRSRTRSQSRESQRSDLSELEMGMVDGDERSDIDYESDDLPTTPLSRTSRSSRASAIPDLDLLSPFDPAVWNRSRTGPGSATSNTSWDGQSSDYGPFS
eukprot:NODE_2323_length_1449_cov_140.538462_g2206_i0.p1 GENE.NODE_2323_length_1449_cov_140.538462_g2206_i0~~NODE_2323_length_1449_cov_140.538462_g2206_i0.p1  ORF type:complete len:356 (-),score=40.92 NODE_2323_length_1449_cov_140.538462_g2206_i0:274-1341(-)